MLLLNPDYELLWQPYIYFLASIELISDMTMNGV